ncbi:unnamed protein product [Leptidea sinapis]|uniref:Protein kinase domain-containing protein n=1 Tax=Leptidea sinapis TaxID=189913 RepID=A0A5E4QX62_9NEOP|nr:unnamed protein product [Leptidea sinapis]
MSGNTESTANSIKFVPMPMSALLANLELIENQAESPDTSFTADNKESPFSDTVAKKCNDEVKTIRTRTPQLKISKDIKTFSSERKGVKDFNKENTGDNLESYRPSNKMCKSSQKLSIFRSYTDENCKDINVLAPNNTNNIIPENKSNSTVRKPSPMVAPVAKAPNSIQKTNATTPKIKSGIRKFTPGSAKHSNKKTPKLLVLQNREKVRCELFRQNQEREEDSAPSAPAPACVPVQDTPLNSKVLPPSYAATPSYPQGKAGPNNSKVLFKTTSIKNKKYMFIKKLGAGGSSEVYKVLEVGTSCEYAVKCVYLNTDQEMAQGYINEVRLLRELQNSDRLDLAQRVNSKIKTGSQEKLEIGVIHADLKPANFLLVCGRLKLIDFGIASAISSDATRIIQYRNY